MKKTRSKLQVATSLILAIFCTSTHAGADNSDADVKSVQQAEKKFNAIEENEILFSPLVDGGNGKYYSFDGWITQKNGKSYVSWFPDVSWDMPKIGFVIENPKIIGELHFRKPVRIVSKYTKNFALPLVNGSHATIPVFTGGYIFAN